MEHVFIELLNMSITASWLVLAIIVFRFLCKKAPKTLTVALWALVCIRLVCPFSLESVLSLIPSAETIPQDIVYTDKPVIHTGIATLNSTINPIISDTFAPNVGDSVNPMQVIIYIASILWILGMIGMMLYTFVSYWTVHRQVRESVRIRDNVWMCDRIDTPFILGVFHPQIYLPSNMGEQDVKYVLAHEKAHIKRHDHWWKPIGFALLTVYWFNPILWIAYVLLCRDIELACDEKVIKEMGEDMKKSYSDALINCSVPRKVIAACPLAFGEVGVKERIKSVLNYKKPAFWVVSFAVAVSVLIAVCFMTDPKPHIDLNEQDDEQYTLSSGIYIAGIKPEDADPTSGALSGQYFHLNTDTRTFRMGGSIAMSFAIFGTYEFDGSKLTLTTDADNPNSYVFYLNEKGGFVYNESESNVEEHNWIEDGLVFGLRSTK